MTETEKQSTQEIKKSSRLTNGLIIAEWITFVGLFIATFSFTQGQLQEQTKRSDAIQIEFAKSMQAQTERTDRLYQEFISLLKLSQSNHSANKQKTIFDLID